MQQITEAGIKALISLLLDEDVKTAAVARWKLIENGTRARPFLSAVVDSDDPRLRARVRPVLEWLRFEDRFREWSGVSADGGDLEQGAYLLSSWAEPEFDPRGCVRRLDAMAEELGRRLGSDRRPAMVIQTLNTYLFGELGFEGDKRSYYEPENSYVHRVLDRKKGIPISMCAVVLFLGRRLSLPIHGITMPCHFIVRYDSPAGGLYFDPFNRGATMSREDCAHFLVELGLKNRIDGMLGVATPRYMLRRMIWNLKQIFEAKKDEHRVRQLTRLHEVLGGNA